MREPASPLGSTNSLGVVTKNTAYQHLNSSDHVPWNTPAITQPNSQINLTNDQGPLLRSVSNASALTSLCADLSPSESHFFEVLYIGKVRISQRKVPESLIDDALVKFAQHEAEKIKTNQLRRNSLLSSQGTSLSSHDSTENLGDILQNLTNKNSNLVAPSTTPLEPDKQPIWKSIEVIPPVLTSKFPEKKELLKKTPPVSSKLPEKNELPQNEEPEKKLEDEFDIFTKERCEKVDCQNLKKPNQVPLEPKVLVLNVAKNNLTTLEEDEEKLDDINTAINDTAVSITKLCKELDKSVDTPNKENVPILKENNPFLSDILDTKDSVNLDDVKKVVREDSPAPMNFEEISRKPKILRHKSILDGDDRKVHGFPENKLFLRDRSASIGTLNFKTPLAHLIGEQNRTMLFQVGRSELRLISPDKKQILLQKLFKDIASCVLGRINKDHFGFVCRETGNETYSCCVFKCESDAVALEVVNAIKLAFVSYADHIKKTREKSPNMTCEHCPMLWFHRLCHDIEGINEKKAHAFILRRIEQLSDEEQEQLITKYQGGTNHMYEVSEHIAFLMMLLRAHCEAKQQRHVHDTAENRSEFLNQYLGGSTIFMKAKRSLSSGFDHLLKRKSSKDDLKPPVIIKKESPVTPNDTPSESVPGLLTPEAPRSKSLSPTMNSNGIVEAPPSPTTLAPPIINEQVEENHEECVQSPMMDIFLKVSDTRGPEQAELQKQATWRQSIYQKVVQPGDSYEGELFQKDLLGLEPVEAAKGKKTKEQLRQLWKMAIDQTILLVRMERENARLKRNEETSAVRRIKLEYTELISCDSGATLVWDNLLSAREASPQVAKVDHHMLRQAVIQGVPRMLRGGAWYYLAEQSCLKPAPPDIKKYPNYNTPYYTLLSGLTKHQHAILIDLGRTFPQHSYFSSALGPGQLGLYNILKAYSLLDPDVGYCQGLSFVAGVLLLHMDEADAFILLRHLMFRRGLRKQYLPDMSALQIQLYQLSRLLRDHEPELHSKLEELEVSPALYAAPWMLTLFTSQFPLGFVVRVFDLIFLESLDIVFAVALALLSAHKDGLMLCVSCEEAAEYLKHKLPDIDRGIYDKVIKKIHVLDISRQLSDYAVEYGVLVEEMPRVSQLTTNNKKLANENVRMGEQLDAAMEAITNYQNTHAHLETQNKVMEQHLMVLSRFIHNKQDLPTDIKKIVQIYNKKLSFGSKLTGLKFSTHDDAITGASTPNLYAKINKEEVTKKLTEEKRSHMKKSQSLHMGLLANKNVLKAVDEKIEKTAKVSIDLINQERLFEQKLKRDFDENLRRLDAKITEAEEKSRKTVSLNIRNVSDKNDSEKNDSERNDSGFVTPITPERRDDVSVISHPLSDCDVDIKFDGHSTKLKQRSFRNRES